MAKQATQSFIMKVDGKRRVVSRGEVVSDRDPAVKANPDSFESIVEDASQPPGEKRGQRARKSEAG